MLVIGLLLVLPIIMIIILSQKELKKYQTSNSYTLEEKSFGPGHPVISGSIQEAIDFQGEITSTKYQTYTGENAAVFVKEKQEVFKGDILMKNASTEVKADGNGIVETIRIENGLTQITVLDIDQVVAAVTTKQKTTDFSVGKTYQSSLGKVTLIKKSNREINGKRTLYFKMEKSPLFGTSLSFQVKTGKEETSVLMIEKEAIYTSVNGETVLRVINDQENVVKEAVVKTGISDGQYIAVSGVDEGTLCDVEYAKYVNHKLDKEATDENTD